jgi:hypothetical protein
MTAEHYPSNSSSNVWRIGRAVHAHVTPMSESGPPIDQTIGIYVGTMTMKNIELRVSSFLPLSL